MAADTSGGNLHQWLKQEGDTVAVGDALAEIETEKAIVEINAEHAGVLGRIVVAAGASSVPVNTVLGVLLADGEDASAIERALAEQGVAPAAAPAAGTGCRNPASSSCAATATCAPATAAAPAQAVPASGGGRRLSSPLARRLAAQWGVDLARVAGSGPHGRILRRDVEAARRRARRRPAASRRAARRRPPRAAQRHAPRHRPPPERKQADRAALLPDGGLPHGRAAGAARAGLQAGAIKLSVNDFIVAPPPGCATCRK